MSSCAIRRWGSGTPCHKETIGAKEVSDKLKEMQAARAQQDALMFPPIVETQPQQPPKNTSSAHSGPLPASSFSRTNPHATSSR